MRAISYIQTNIEAGKTIASDPLTTIMLRAATENPTLDSISDPIYIRKTKSFRIVSPAVNVEETEKLLKQTNTDFVLINTTFTDQLLSDYFSVQTKTTHGKILVDKFLDNPEFFELLYNQDGIYLFRVL
jgi:hypothetical protein